MAETNTTSVAHRPTIKLRPRLSLPLSAPTQDAGGPSKPTKVAPASKLRDRPSLGLGESFFHSRHVEKYVEIDVEEDSYDSFGAPVPLSESGRSSKRRRIRLDTLVDPLLDPLPESSPTSDLALKAAEAKLIQLDAKIAQQKAVQDALAAEFALAVKARDEARKALEIAVKKVGQIQEKSTAADQTIRTLRSEKQKAKDLRAERDALIKRLKQVEDSMLAE